MFEYVGQSRAKMFFCVPMVVTMVGAVKRAKSRMSLPDTLSHSAQMVLVAASQLLH